MTAEAMEICGIVDLDIDETGEVVTVAYLRIAPDGRDAEIAPDADVMALDLAL